MVEPVFSSTSFANEQEAERPVRISSFFALILGILSGVAVLTTVLLVIPVLAILCAAIALRPSSRGVPVGRTAAFAGALLAVFFGSWSWFQATTRQQALQEHAAEFSQDWLETLQQGKSELALELSSPVSSRQHEKMLLKRFYESNEIAHSNLEDFLERPLVADILAGGESLEWEVSEPPIVLRQRSSDRAIVRLKETGGVIGDTVEISLLRSTSQGEEPPRGEWYVSDFQYCYEKPANQ